MLSTHFTNSNPSCGLTQSDIVLVTGGASGIGAATALRFADSGAKVIVGDLNAPSSKLADDFARLQIQWHQCNVCQLDELKTLVNEASGQGTFKVLVNNAGVGMTKPVSEVSEADWDHCLNTNLKSVFFATQYALPAFEQAGGGVVINTASNAGLLPRAHDPVYSASKQALVGLTKTLALCLSAQNIRVNAVCPGPVEQTGIMNADLEMAADEQALIEQMISASPLANANQRMIHPYEVAEAIYYLASPAAALITGTMIAIDGGKSLGMPPKKS